MNTSHLSNPILLEKICIIWESEEIHATEKGEPPSTLLNRGLTNASKLVREWGKQKASIRKLKEDALCSAHYAAQLALQVNPRDTTLQEEAHITGEALQEFENIRVEWADNIIKSCWILDGHRCSNFFF